MDKKMDHNFLVLREDIINSWRWTEELKSQIEKIKQRQERMENIIKNLIHIIEEKIESRETGRKRRYNITENTNL